MYIKVGRISLGPEIKKDYIHSLCSYFYRDSYKRRDDYSITFVSEIARFVKRKQ